jgi:hypothetical protein
VNYDSESCEDMTEEWMHWKLQTRPLVREAPHDKRNSRCLNRISMEEKEHLVAGPRWSSWLQDRLADCPSVVR